MKERISRFTLTLFFILSGMNFLSLAQTNTEFKKENFLSNLSGLALAEKDIKAGNDAFEESLFRIALQNYLRANDFNPNDALLNYKIGVCYLNSSFKSKAKNHLEKALSLKSDVAPDIHYYLGVCNHLELNWEKAESEYELYKSKVLSENNDVELKKVNKRIEECENGRRMVKKPIRVKIENLGAEVNSSYTDYSPVIDEDEATLMFTSRRPGTTVGSNGEKDESIDEYWEDIYVSFMFNGKWAKPKNIGAPVNTTGHEASNNMSPDGELLFIYIDKNGQGDIYACTLENLVWSKPVELKAPVNTKSHETSATVNKGKDTLYFVSERPGGYGGKDIYMVTRVGNAEWGNLQNVGPIINTEWDEESVYLMPSGKTLYFSSKGHDSMGGYDIFRSEWVNGKWSDPINLGYPLSSADDDVNFVMVKGEKKGYYSSVKYEGFGERDLYTVNFLTGKEETDSVDVEALAGKERIIKGKKLLGSAILKGLVTDGYNQTPLAATILISDASTGMPVDTVLTKAGDGNYAVYIPSGKSYKVEASSPNYNSSVATVNIPQSNTNIEIEKDFQLVSLSSVTTILRGKVIDVLTKAPLSANLIIKDNVKDLEIANIKTDASTGEYEVAVPSGKIYSIVVKAPEYMPFYDDINIPMSQKNQVITKNAELNDLKVGSKIVLKNIFYDFDKATLRPASIVELDHLIELLNEYPTMRIEISSHTDNKGTPEYNIVLSNNRSKSCVDYLISKKVDKKRLEFKGYGLTQPIATNDTDAGRQLNRRTEFKILSR